MGFYIRKTKIQNYSVWTETKTKDKRTREPVKREAYPTLGFNYAWTYEEAVAWAKQCNKKDQHERRKIVAAAKRTEESELFHEIYLPPTWLKEFDSHIDDLALGSDAWGKKLKIHWTTAKKLILSLEISPPDFKASHHKITSYMLKKRYSVGYIKRLRYILNQWGSFYSRKTKSYFEEIPALSSNQREKVIEAHEEKENVRKTSVPIDWDYLKTKQETFASAKLTLQFNWLMVACWFGLRPIEVDHLKTPQGKYWRVETTRDGQKELYVFQTKLRGISKEQRWKVIPVYFPEQVKALEIIEAKAFKRPLVKSMVKHLDIEGVDTYSPRKGFTDFMRDKGFDIEDVAVFMGHRDINQTWSAYKQRTLYKLPHDRQLKIAK